MPRSVLDIIGDKSLKRKLQRLEKREAKRSLRKAARKGLAVLRRAVRQATPVDEGVLRKAQDIKVIGRGLVIGGIVGANVQKLQAAHASDPSRPTNIDWLVEEGHVAPDGTVIPPSGYMRRAAQEATPRALQAVEDTLRDEIEKGALS